MYLKKALVSFKDTECLFVEGKKYFKKILKTQIVMF